MDRSVIVDPFPEIDRPPLARDEGGIQPFCKAFGIAHRGGQTDDLHVRVLEPQLRDHHLKGPAAGIVADQVDLVNDEKRDAFQPPGFVSDE